MTASLVPLVAQQQTGGGFATVVIPLLLMVAIFYFLLIRPQQRRVRGQRELMASLDVGDEVVTIGGMFGRIVRMDDESVTLDVGSGSELRFVKNAIARKLVQDKEADESS